MAFAGGDVMRVIDNHHKRIKHVHWKDMGPEWQARRGTIFGCGMATIALGDGVIDLPPIIRALPVLLIDCRM